MSIDHVILDFPMILVVSYTCAITLSLMYNGLASNTPHTKTMNVPQNCLKVPRVYLSEGAPEVFQAAPTFFRHILLLQHLASANCRL